MKQILIVSMTLLFPSLLIGQIVCVTTDGKPCPPDPEMKYCQNEPITPNLSVAKTAHVRGILVEEESGLPMVFKNEIVQLRDAKSLAVLINSTVNEQGLFDLGVVSAGEFRLLALRRKPDSSLERLPETDQPKKMICIDETDCNVRAIQHTHGTDWLYEFCPPK